MCPKLKDGDFVIIDISLKFMGDGLYVIDYNNIFMVKMLQLLPNGKFLIKSIKQEYRSYEIEQDAQSIFNVVGRVVRSIV